MTHDDERLDVVVVGAGLAGLAAAVHLHRAGRRVAVTEAGDGVGGRVRTDAVDGFRLDRGFQILLTDYPEVRAQLDLEALRLRRFEPGAMVWRDGTGHVVADPLRAPSRLLATLRAPVASTRDKLRLLELRRDVRRGPARRLLTGPDMSTLEALSQRGFSDQILHDMFRPLFGGIQLDAELSGSSRMSDLIYRSLSNGDAALPSDGMGAIPHQLASRLPPGTVRLRSAVVGVEPDRVTVDGGATVRGDAVVVATDGPMAHRLLGTRAVASRSVSCVYFDAPSPPPTGRFLALDGGGAGPAINVATISNVAPGYAPSGRHLVACVVLGLAGEGIEDEVRTQLRGWWGTEVDGWRHLRTYRIAHGQPDSAPPFHPRRPVVLGNGLYVCGDHRDTPSIQGALYSGRRCAEAVLQR